MHLSPKARNSQVQAMCRFIAGSVASERHSAIRDAFTQSDPDSCAIAQLSHPYPRHKCGSALRERAAWWLMPDDRARDDVLQHSCLSIAENPSSSSYDDFDDRHSPNHRRIIYVSIESSSTTPSHPTAAPWQECLDVLLRHSPIDDFQESRRRRRDERRRRRRDTSSR